MAKEDNKKDKKAQEQQPAKKPLAAKKTKEREEKQQDAMQIAPKYAIPLIALAAIIGLVYYLLIPNVTTTFPTFLGNFRSAPRVALAVTYGNITQYGFEEPCATQIIQMIAHTRNATTIDIFVMNKTTCYYSPSGLGHAINISTVSASTCLGYAKSEPSVYLNFSSANGTLITPYHLHVDGNAAYMNKCGIAVDLG